MLKQTRNLLLTRIFNKKIMSLWPQEAYIYVFKKLEDC